MVDLVECSPKTGEVDRRARRNPTRGPGLPDNNQTLPTAISGGSDPLFPGGIVTPFSSKDGKVYTIETYRSGPSQNGFLDIDGILLDTVTGLYLRVYPERNKALSVDRMMHSLSHPRTILELVKYGDEPIGYGIFPRFNIETEPETGGGKVVEPVLYSSRAFLPAHEGQGLGTHVLDEAIKKHKRELARSGKELRWGALMTMTPLSPYTLEKIPSIEEIFPLQKRYDKNREAQSLMLGVHKAVRMHSRAIVTATGVSRGELKELGMNDTWRPKPDAGRVYKIFQEMVTPEPKGLDMHREQGDVVYVLFRLKRPVIEPHL